MERILQSEEVRLRLLKQAAELPLSPGIYLMKDKSGRVIYVGKSKRLKNRVSQYFQNNDKNPKTERMVSLVHHFDTILCDTEIEALSLENSLIKQYQKLFSMDDVELEFSQEALDAVAELALDRHTGARGLRAILESAMTKLMYEIPSRADIDTVVITADTVKGGEPTLVLKRDTVEAI